MLADRDDRPARIALLAEDGHEVVVHATDWALTEDGGWITCVIEGDRYWYPAHRVAEIRADGENGEERNDA